MPKYYQLKGEVMKDVKTMLILVLKEYISLLNEELDALAGLAHVHGWKSTSERILRGENLRKSILDLSIKVRESD